MSEPPAFQDWLSVSLRPALKKEFQLGLHYLTRRAKQFAHFIDGTARSRQLLLVLGVGREWWIVYEKDHPFFGVFHERCRDQRLSNDLPFLPIGWNQNYETRSLTSVNSRQHFA